jgi:hypothetical protein
MSGWRYWLSWPVHTLMHALALNYVVLAIRPDGYYMCCVWCGRLTFYATFEELDRLIDSDIASKETRK